MTGGPGATGTTGARRGDADHWGAVRERTVRWEDPTGNAERAVRMSGLEWLRGMLDGRVAVAPIAATLGFEAVGLEDGRVTFAVTPGEHHYNPIGTVHGGLAATLLDSAMGCAVHTTLPAGVAYTTLDLQVRYLRPILVGSGRLTCEGEVASRGRRVRTATGRLVDGDGRLYATGTTACLLTEVAVVAPGT